MNTINSTDSTRPFGFWLKAVDRLMAAEFAAAFESEGITRREWRLLNVIDGTTPAGPRPLGGPKLGRLHKLGWIERTGDDWALTDEGRAAKQRLGAVVDGIRAKVEDAVPAEDLATSIATLEQLTRAFGWEEGTPLPRKHDGRGHRRGFGSRHGFGGRGFAHQHGFEDAKHDHLGHGARGHGRGFGHQHGFGEHGFERHGFEGAEHGHPGHGARGHGRGFGRGFGRGPRGHFAHFAQDAYERGFDAGYARGHSA